jgi:hypothetical protein
MKGGSAVAYTKILSIKKKGHLNAALDYVMNADKTNPDVWEREEEKKQLDTLTEYVTKKDKTEEWDVRFVSAINCFPKTAAQKMMATKKKYGKTDKRLAYHIIQSFAPGEITPELAHEVGVKYAEAWLEDYEVVIGTHLDRGHFHNHILLNSVSCVDGRKFHMNKSEFYSKLYGISNDLCRQYGLSVIENIDSRHMTYEEWVKRYGKGGRTLREIIHADVLECIARARTVGEFFVLMENMGYEVDLAGKYAKVRMLERERFFRLSTLGFPDDVLRDMITGKQPVRRKAKPVYYGCGPSRRRGHKLTRIEAMYVHWLFVLGKIKTRTYHVSLPAGEFRKFERYKEQLKFAAANRISGLREAAWLKDATVKQIKRLDEEKFRVRGALRKNRELFAAHRNYMRYLPIADKLEGEHRKRFEEAKEALRKKGFEEQPEKIGLKRAELLDAAARNKREIARLRGRLGMLDVIIESSGHIREQIKKELEVDVSWKEKRQDSSYRERR